MRLGRAGLAGSLVLAATLSMVAAQETPPTRPTQSGAVWNVRDHVPAGAFVIQSHRGAGELAPENTLEAFQLGWKLGTVPESDLRTTRDGVIVAFHDENFKRVVKGANPELQKKGVADLTWKELSALDVGGWKGEQFVGRHVSTMDEVFALMEGHPERHLYLDIKNVDLKQLAELVKKRSVQRQVILASTHYEIIREWKALVPESDTLHWMGGDEATLKKRFEDLRKTGFADITQLQIHVRRAKAPAKGLTPSNEFLIAAGNEVRSHGILFQTLPWGISEPGVYWALMDVGVASFATDHPDVTLKAVRDYYAQRPVKP